MAQFFDVCIQGDGVVGRTMALLLARERLRVAWVTGSASTTRAHDVRAFALNAASRELLQGLRCWPEGTASTAVATMDVHGDRGGLVKFRAQDLGQDALAWIVDVPALLEQLQTAIRYQPLIEIVSAGDAAPAAALTVVCEGRSSQTREALGVEFDLTPYRQHAIACRVSSAMPHGQVARQWFQQGEILALLPLDGVGGNSCAVVWSVTDERAHPLMSMSDTDFAQQLSDASHHAWGKLALQSPRSAWPLQWAQARRWCGALDAQRSWVLAGDAAHTVHPLAGQGLNLGLADAQQLTQTLHTREYWRPLSDLRLLRRYERARKARSWPITQANHGLHTLFDLSLAGGAELRNWGMWGFDRSTALKRWASLQAMGLAHNF